MAAEVARVFDGGTRRLGATLANPDPPMELNGPGWSYAREVFQLRHDGQRSNQDGCVEPQATQR